MASSFFTAFLLFCVIFLQKNNVALYFALDTIITLRYILPEDIMKTITFNPAQFHLLSLVASAQGLTVEEYVSSTLSRLFKSLADLQGIQPAPQVTTEQVQAPGASGVSVPRLTRSARRAAKRAAGQIPAAAAPTPEQAEELRRQVGKYLTGPSTPKPHEIQVEGYDPSFRPDPENFGTL